MQYTVIVKQDTGRRLISINALGRKFGTNDEAMAYAATMQRKGYRTTVTNW